MYLFLEPRQEGGGHGGQAGEGLAELDGGLDQVSEEGHRDAVNVGHGRAVQLDAPEKNINVKFYRRTTIHNAEGP